MTVLTHSLINVFPQIVLDTHAILFASRWLFPLPFWCFSSFLCYSFPSLPLSICLLLSLSLSVYLSLSPSLSIHLPVSFFWFLPDFNFWLNSFRSYSNTRNHNRRSPTPSSTRSASYHSPTRNASPQGISTNSRFENWFQFSIIPTVLSRPSSPATSARHSHSPILNRSVQPKLKLTDDTQSGTQSTQSVRW